MLSDYETLVANLVRDDASRISQADLQDAIGWAVARYSRDRPRIVVEDLTPADGYTLPLPAAWEEGFSALSSLEYPIGENPISLVDPARYGLYRDPTPATVIRLIDAVDTGAEVRATVTVTHVVSSSEDTVPTADREPLACWAAALACDQLAAFYSGGTDSTIQADSVRQQSKSQEYAARAKSLRARYLAEIGVAEKNAAPASAVVSLRPSDSRGEPRLTHGAEYRASRVH